MMRTDIKNKWSVCFTICLMLMNCLLFTACNKDEEDNSVILKSFGPSPALRGGELRFIGANLGKIEAVVLPGLNGKTIEVTDITVVDDREVKITIPQEAGPGLITLKTSQGDITTMTPITYSEPISISKFSPTSFKAGAKLTIEGDYLNLIKKIIFSDNVIVEEKDFVSQERKKIEVIVPIEAQTGKVRISNGAEIPIEIYTQGEVTITLPTIASVTPNPLKAGDALTIKGQDFDLVSKVVLPGGKVIEVKDATTEIKIASTPNDIKEGLVTLVAKSGVEVFSNELKLVKPLITSLSGNTVKNNESFTINGTNLDLVSEVVFQAADAVKSFTSKSETKIVLQIPAKTTDGKFILKTLSATETEGTALAFVKPLVAGFSATSIKANEKLTLTGTNLDLVSEVKFGTMKGAINSATATNLNVTVPVGAVSGHLTLTTVNGTVITTTQSVTIDVTLPIITSITALGPGNKITITGQDLNLIKTIYFADGAGNYTIKCTDYGTKTTGLVEFYHVEGSATGKITPKMVTFDGDEGFMPVVWCAGTEPVTSASILLFDFEGGALSGSVWGAGSIIKENGNSYYKGSGSVADGTFTWFFAANQNGRPTLSDLSNKVLKFDMKAIHDFTPGSYKIQWCLGGNWGWCTSGHFPLSEDGVTCTTGGGWITVTCQFSSLGISAVGNGDSGLACQLSTFDWSNICIDNVRIDPK